MGTKEAELGAKNSKMEAKEVKRGAKLARRWHTENDGTRGDKVFITRAELRDIIADKLDGKLSDKFSFRIADSEFYCTPLDDAREILEQSTVDRRQWSPETFDCDDFAHVLKAHFAEASYKDGERRPPHCFGIVWGMLSSPFFTHAMNWMIDENREFWFIEPQSDEIFKPRETDRNIYFMLI